MPKELLVFWKAGGVNMAVSWVIDIITLFSYSFNLIAKEVRRRFNGKLQWSGLPWSWSMSACFKERIFHDVVLSIPFNKRKISSTSAVQTLPDQLTGTSTVKLYTPVCEGVEFGPANVRKTQTWGNMSKCLVSSRNRSKPWAAHYSFSSETDGDNVKPPTTCYADRHRDVSRLLAEFLCMVSHFHWWRISATSGTRQGAASSTLFRQYLMWLLWRLPYDRNLRRWSVRVSGDCVLVGR
jgi:hypothetical protein